MSLVSRVRSACAGVVGVGLLASPGAAPAGIADPADRVLRWLVSWYQTTPPLERVGWGGLVACAVLGLGSLAARWLALRPKSIVPRGFRERFPRRLASGELGAGKALDYCDLHPSPASRVALAALRRADRPAADQERAVALALRVEVDRLRRPLGTLRRIAYLAPLIGFLGTLGGVGRALGQGVSGAELGPLLGVALGPLTAGVALAILAFVAYDGLSDRVERQAAGLDRIGVETLDALSEAGLAEPRRTPRPHALGDAGGVRSFRDADA